MSRPESVQQAGFMYTSDLLGVYHTAPDTASRFSASPVVGHPTSLGWYTRETGTG